jgi:hypothetical protein
MRTVIRISAALICALAISSCASDDPQPKQAKWNPNGKGGTTDWHSPIAILLKYQTSHDGSLTRVELEKGLKADFDAADKNHTGCLDSDEVTQINEERMKYDESAASPLIDWKNNPGGCVDFDEYSALPRSIFEELDVKGDGTLTRKELHPPKTAPGPGGKPVPASGGGGY